MIAAESLFLLPAWPPDQQVLSAACELHIAALTDCVQEPIRRAAPQERGQTYVGVKNDPRLTPCPLVGLDAPRAPLRSRERLLEDLLNGASQVILNCVRKSRQRNRRVQAGPGIALPAMSLSRQPTSAPHPWQPMRRLYRRSVQARAPVRPGDQRAGAAAGTTTTVSPPVLPRSPVAPVPPVLPVAPVEPVEPTEPVDPVAPVGPAGPGTVTTAGVTTVAFSHALTPRASTTAENRIEYFMRIPLDDYLIE